jgi:hypothetical protein
MISRPDTRRTAALVLAFALLLWTQTGVAMASPSAHGLRCHARMSSAQDRTNLKAASDMPCCPGHGQLLTSQLQAPSATLARPDCCKLSGQPVRPSAFIVATERELPNAMRAVGSSAQNLVPSRRNASLQLTSSPPPTLAVLDKKSDLRI